MIVSLSNEHFPNMFEQLKKSVRRCRTTTRTDWVKLSMSLPSCSVGVNPSFLFMEK
jgi:hypothetical protein